MAMDARDLPDSKVDVSFLSRKKPKTKPASDVKRAYGTTETKPENRHELVPSLSAKSEKIKENSEPSVEIPAKLDDVPTQEVKIVTKVGTDDMPKANQSALAEIRVSDRVAELRELTSKLGGERAMRFLIFREMGGQEGLVHASQTELADFLQIKSPTALRAFVAELCNQGAISIVQDYNASERIARTYKIEWGNRTAER